MQALAEAASPELATEPDGYRKLVNDAVAEYGRRNFAEARELFSRAHSLFPNARTLRGLGASEFELRNYTDSISDLEQALASSVKPLDPALRERTERLLERARSFVGRVQLDVHPTTSTALIDGLPVRSAKEVLLEVGDHVIELQAPGYLPEKRKLRINGGECKTVSVALTLQIDLTPTSSQLEQPRYLRRNPWLWTGVGAVISGAALGLGLALRPTHMHYDGGDTHTVVGR
jgi:tetratricopeptide (TPR) repeat protein